MNRELLQRLMEAWDSSPLPKASDGMMQERMEELRAALAVGDSVSPVEPVATIEHTVGGSLAYATTKAAWSLPMGVEFKLYTHAIPPDVQRDAGRYRWLANKVLCADYGDNETNGKQVGWRIVGSLCGSAGERQPSFMYGPSINDAIDAAMTAPKVTP